MDNDRVRITHPEVTDKKITGIIQARMGSSRLPEKMNLDLHGFPLITWVLRRVRQSELIGEFVLATSSDPANDYLANQANEFGIKVFRGSEVNVLSRFTLVAQQFGSDIIVRICADNPLIDSREIDRLITFFVQNQPDYAFNHIPGMGNNYVNGVGAEVLSIATLLKLQKKSYSKDQLEHVTKYLWDYQNEFNIRTIDAPLYYAYPNLKFDIDSEEDMIKIGSLLNKKYGNRIIVPEKVDVKNLIKVYLRTKYEHNK